jgi:membrane-associated phospholipid phosphatase
MSPRMRGLYKYFTHACHFRMATIAFMIGLVFLVPFYIFIGCLITPVQQLHRPEIHLDMVVQISPVWVIAYLSLWAFWILPLLLVKQDALLRKVVLAFITAWIVSYLFFLSYPTVAPRPTYLACNNFFSWCLQLVYMCDPAYNCFPSLHVAQCYVSAMACYQVNRNAGMAACLWASLVAVSTIFTKQHYIADVVAGVFLGLIVYLLWLRSYPRSEVTDEERRAAPFIMIGLAAFHVLIITGFYIAYQIATKAKI